jgi:HK97 gp10 family phage protein
MAERTPDVLGIGDMQRKFAMLAKDMETRVARAMVVSGGRLIRDQAKANIKANGSYRTGDMYKNVVVKREKRAQKGTAEYHIGVRHGKNLTRKQKAGPLKVGARGRVVLRDDPWYWFLVEYTGARPHSLSRGSYLARKGRKRSKQKGRPHPGFKPKPFLRPAFEARKEDAIKAMEARLDKELAKARR